MKHWLQVLAQKEFTLKLSGDSGDGIQLLGKLLAELLANQGWDIRTQADFPAEIRAPRGSVRGVSSYLIHAHQHHAPTHSGDHPDLILAINPAAVRKLKNIEWEQSCILYDENSFDAKSLKRAELDGNWLTALNARANVDSLNLSEVHKTALQKQGFLPKDIERSRNLFVLGLLGYLLAIPIEQSEHLIQQRTIDKPELLPANLAALQAGYSHGRMLQDKNPSQVSKETQAETQRLVNGNEAIALALLTAARLADRPLFYSSYPITPATDILHELAKLRCPSSHVHQAEDEIAAIGAAIGAAFGGHLAACATSGPGLSLKSEFLGLAVMAELPLVIIDVQRAGPSTGMPTKTSQSDLNQALFGRHGDSPLPVLACSSPADCFSTVIKATRIAIDAMTPVIVLSDATLAFGSENWRVPRWSSLAKINQHNSTALTGFQPYARDPSTGSRPWIAAGTEGGIHCLGGLEKEPISGRVSSLPEDHRQMSHQRRQKIEHLSHLLGEDALFGPLSADLMILSWGSTLHAVRSAVIESQSQGYSVSHLHLQQLMPLASNLGEFLHSAHKVLVAELNDGQLYHYLGGDRLAHMASYTEQTGLGFASESVVAEIKRQFAKESSCQT